MENTDVVTTPFSSDAPTASDGLTVSPDQQIETVRDAASVGSASASPTDGLEAGFYKLLMNPLMDQLEESVNKNNEILDTVMLKMKEDREQMRKKQLGAHIPAILQGQGRDLAETIQHIENFIEFENYDPEISDRTKLRKANQRELDKFAEMAIVGHSIAAFVSTLDAPHLKHLATKIVTDVTTWVAKLFRFTDASAYFHEEEKEGLTKICQLALHRKYPKYATDGFEVLYPRPPVIYISSAAKPNLGQYVCHQLGLPLSCLCTVPCDITRINIGALQKLIEDDTNSGKTPTIVIAYAGTPLAGQTDDMTRLNELCRLYDLWLHLEGCGLSMLATQSVPPHLATATLANSATLHLGHWLRLPAIPLVTLFRSPDVTMTRVVGLSTFNVRYKLNCFSLWMCLINLGHDRIAARLQYYTSLSRMIHDGLVQIATTNELMILQMESPIIIVRYQPKTDKEVDDTGELSRPADEGRSDVYFDTLNIWLVEALRREVPDVHITAIEVPKLGLCLRYAPLEIGDMFEMNRLTVETFLDCFDRHVHILDATVAVKKDFADIVESQDNLRLVHLPTWAGLGAIQYIPTQWLDKIDSLTDVGKNEINVLNQQMVSKLKSTDTAFSLGVTQNGLFCVRFGLVTAETDLEELIAMVYATGKEVEESSKYVESLADIVKQGIERAVEDLERENQAKIMQEGLLRQVPIVGSLLNWWSPPPKDPVKGRTFNLASGTVASTESTYKYHMQIQESIPDPVPKSRDGPLKAMLKPPKGRQRLHQDTSSETSLSDHIEMAPCDGSDAVQVGTEHQPLLLAPEALVANGNPVTEKMELASTTTADGTLIRATESCDLK
jgi:hypothetical protein